MSEFKTIDPAAIEMLTVPSPVKLFSVTVRVVAPEPVTTGLSCVTVPVLFTVMLPDTNEIAVALLYVTAN